MNDKLKKLIDKYKTSLDKTGINGLTIDEYVDKKMKDGIGYYKDFRQLEKQYEEEYHKLASHYDNLHIKIREDIEIELRKEIAEQFENEKFGIAYVEINPVTGKIKNIGLGFDDGVLFDDMIKIKKIAEDIMGIPVTSSFNETTLLNLSYSD